MVGFIYIFYTYPITWAATYGSSNATQFFGGDPRFTSKQVYGFIRALLLNFFLTACPEMFLSLANFGSNATSMVDAGKLKEMLLDCNPQENEVSHH